MRNEGQNQLQFFRVDFNAAIKHEDILILVLFKCPRQVEEVSINKSPKMKLEQNVDNEFSYICFKSTKDEQFAIELFMNDSEKKVIVEQWALKDGIIKVVEFFYSKKSSYHINPKLISHDCLNKLLGKDNSEKA